MIDFIPFNLQLFAEGEADAAAGADSTNAAEETQIERMFSQADVDRMINQRMARWQRDADRRAEQARQQGRSEAERLAQMSDDERARHEREQTENNLRERETKLATREAELERRELRATALETLAAKGLPKGLADILDYASADACNASITNVEKAFRAAVKEAVDAQLKNSAVELPRGNGAKAERELTDGEKLAEKVINARTEAHKNASEALKKYYL